MEAFLMGSSLGTFSRASGGKGQDSTFFPSVLPKVRTGVAAGTRGRCNAVGDAMVCGGLQKAARDAGGLPSPALCLAQTCVSPVEITL